MTPKMVSVLDAKMFHRPWNFPIYLSRLHEAVKIVKVFTQNAYGRS